MEDIVLGRTEALRTLAEEAKRLPDTAQLSSHLHWTPEDDCADLGTAIRQAVGAASTCWEDPAGTGTFQSEQALMIAAGLEEWIIKNAIATIEQAHTDGEERPEDALRRVISDSQELDGRRQIQISRQRETIGNLLAFLREHNMVTEFTEFQRNGDQLHASVSQVDIDDIISQASGQRDRVEMYRATNGEYSWRRIAPNGQVVSVPGETFARMSAAWRSAKRNNSNVSMFIIDPNSNIEDQEDSHGRQAEQGHQGGQATGG